MKTVATLDSALDALYSYVDYSRTHVRDIRSAVFSLNNIRELLDRLGNPQRFFRSIHVAGTKGKGSVCAMIAAGLSNGGYKTGFYSSPHLSRFNERFRIDGAIISDERLIALTDRVLSVLDETFRPSTFDLMTAIAFLYFAEEKVDFAVVETGLGGRLDSTNILESILTAITSISLDHTAFLGGTIELIAAEKAGILKAGVPAIIAPEHPLALKTISDRAKAVGAPVTDLRAVYAFETVSDSLSGQTLVIREREATYQNSKNGTGRELKIRLNLIGAHQAVNAAVAAAALIQLERDRFIASASDCFAGFSKVDWRCRFEVLRMDDGRTVVFDGAHNLDSAEKLTDTLNRYFHAKRICFVLGFSEDKDVRSIIERFVQIGSEFIATRSTHPRAADPAEVAAVIRGYNRHAVVTDSLENAIFKIRSMIDVEVFVVTGSLFVAGGIRELLSETIK